MAMASIDLSETVSCALLHIRTLPIEILTVYVSSLAHDKLSKDTLPTVSARARVVRHRYILSE